MIKKTNKKHVLLTQPLLTKRRFMVGKISAIIGLLIIIITFTLTFYYWQSITWYVKVSLAFIVFSLSPGIEDLKFLALSYAKYKEEWEKYNERKNE